MITRKRLNELVAWRPNAPLITRGAVHVAGPADWVEAIKTEGYPANNIDKLLLNSKEPWVFEYLPVQPKVRIRKEQGGWLAKWKYLGVDTVIHFTPDVTYNQIAEPIRAAYAKCVGQTEYPIEPYEGEQPEGAK